MCAVRTLNRVEKLPQLPDYIRRFLPASSGSVGAQMPTTVPDGSLLGKNVQVVVSVGKPGLPPQVESTVASADTVPLPPIPLVPLAPEDYATHIVYSGIELRLNQKARMCPVGFREMTPAQKFAALPKTGWIPVGWASYDPSAERIERSDGVVVRVKPGLNGMDLQWDWQLLNNDEKLARDVWESAAEPPAQRATTSLRVLRRIQSSPTVDAVVAKPTEAVVVAKPREVERTSTYGKLEFKTLARLPAEFKLQYFYDQWGQNSEGGWCAHSSVTLAAALQISSADYVRTLRGKMVTAGHLEVREVRGKRSGHETTQYRSCNSPTELERGQAACDAWNEHIGGRIEYAMPGGPRATRSRALKAATPGTAPRKKGSPANLADSERDELIHSGVSRFHEVASDRGHDVPLGLDALLALVPVLRKTFALYPTAALDTGAQKYMIDQLIALARAKRVRDSAKWYTDAVRKDYAKSFPRLLAEVAEPSRD